MKHLKIILVLISFIFFSIQNSNVQDRLSDSKSIAIINAPKKVKEALKNYSGSKIDKQATFTKKNGTTVYTFKIEKRVWVNYLLINKKGKILGIKSDEDNL